MNRVIIALLVGFVGGCDNNNDNDLLNNDTTIVDTVTNVDDSTDTSSSSGTAQDSDSDSIATEIDTDILEWQQANLTWYESYPDEGSAECIEYNGCQWAGWFAGLSDQMSPEWVEQNNIAAVHSDHFSTYDGKTLRVRRGTDNQIDVVVYDMCSDDDCDGCCTNNMWKTKFLIDMEIHTAERFGISGGIVEFACIDCN